VIIDNRVKTMSPLPNFQKIPHRSGKQSKFSNPNYPFLTTKCINPGSFSNRSISEWIIS
jgi:hypothetical protein